VHEVAVAVARRTLEVSSATRALDRQSLLGPSLLPGWSRLTVLCHLRYGASALLRMTAEALAGEPTSYYPEGRAAQRPGTLAPQAGESGRAVADSLGDIGAALDAAWAPLRDDQWQTLVVEPPDNPDLGTRSLLEIAVLRLTEVEVHGTDLDIGLSDWSDVFVRTALPLRMERLRTRRVAGEPISASWQFDVNDGPSYLVTVDGSTVDVWEARLAEAAVQWSGTSRDLLALLLGRPTIGASQSTTSKPELVEAFGRAFPGP
jgi:maleylpyruvate isomerase